MRSRDELQALVLQIVIHDALVVPCHSDRPLLNFAHESLISFGGYPSDVAVGVGVLAAQLIGISRKDVLQGNVDWTVWTAREERVLRELLAAVDLFGESLVAFLLIFLRDVLQDALDAADCQLGLHQVRPIETIDAVCSEHSYLLLHYLFLSESFPYKESKFGENIFKLRHQLIDLVKSVAVRLSVEVVPDMLD